MKINKLIWIMVLLVVIGLTCAGCGGGDSNTTPPPVGPNPGDYNNGDPEEPILPGNTPAQFTLPGGQAFGDLRGVASSQQYVYVGDANNLYCFDKLGDTVRLLSRLPRRSRRLQFSRRIRRLICPWTRIIRFPVFQ